MVIDVIIEIISIFDDFSITVMNFLAKLFAMCSEIFFAFLQYHFYQS